MSFPREDWTQIRTNNPLERSNREIKRLTRVVGTFPDGESALVLVAARLATPQPAHPRGCCGENAKNTGRYLKNRGKTGF